MAQLNFNVVDNSKLVASATEEQCLRALTIMAETAEGYAKLNCATKFTNPTGRLMNSIAHVIDVGEKKAYIGTNVHYAPYVEFGTGRAAEEGMGGNQSIPGMMAKPYLRPAISEHVDEYKKIAKEELSK